MGVIDSNAVLANLTEATASKGTLSVGPGPWDGQSTGAFKGSASGTVIAADAASGFGGNLIDAQLAGASKFQVDASGNVWQPNASGVLIKINRFEELTADLLAATVSHTIFIADDSYQIVGVQAVFNVQGGSGATVTVEVCTGTQAPGAGTAQLTGAISLQGTANTVAAGTLIASPTTIASGNRVGIVMAGTLTGLVGNITVAIKRV